MIQKQSFVKRVWNWVSKPTMNKLVFTVSVLFLGMFLWSYFETEGQLSYFPAAFLISSGNVSILYLVDRVGFRKIDTVAYMRTHPETYYKVLLPLYALLIASGPIVALFIATS